MLPDSDLRPLLQGRAAGAEVVHGQPDARLPEEPDHLRALAWKDCHLVCFADRVDDGLPYPRRAAGQTPAPSYRATCWRTLRRHPGLGPEERGSRILPDVKALVEHRPRGPELNGEPDRAVEPARDVGRHLFSGLEELLVDAFQCLAASRLRRVRARN